MKRRTILVGGLVGVIALAAPAAAKTLIGGSCSYRDAAGTATIVSVEKTAESIAQAKTGGGPGYEGYEVHFKFTPKTPDPDLAGQVDRPLLLQLTNSWYPGPRFLAKYGIKAGRMLPAVAKVRTRGACSPFVYEFPGIDLADYFESR